MMDEVHVEAWQQLLLLALSVVLIALLCWIFAGGDAGEEPSKPKGPLPVFGANFGEEAKKEAKRAGKKKKVQEPEEAAASEEATPVKAAVEEVAEEEPPVVPEPVVIEEPKIVEPKVPKAAPKGKSKSKKAAAVPEAPLAAPAPAEPEAPLSPEQKALQNKIRNAQKKLREVEELKARKAAGEKLTSAQVDKVKQEGAHLQAIEEVQQAMAAPAVPAVLEEPTKDELLAQALAAEMAGEEQEEEETFEDSKAKKKNKKKNKQQEEVAEEPVVEEPVVEEEVEVEAEEEEAEAEVEAEVEEEEEEAEAEEAEAEEEAEDEGVEEEGEEVEEEAEAEEEEAAEEEAAEEEADEEAAEEEAGEAEAEEEAAEEEAEEAAEEEAGEAEAGKEAAVEEVAEEEVAAEEVAEPEPPKEIVRPKYPPTEREKEMMKVNKKLREIEAVERKLAEGVTLAANQQQKLTKKDGLLEELEILTNAKEPHTIVWPAVVEEYLNPSFGVRLRLEGKADPLVMLAAHMNPPISTDNLSEISQRYKVRQELQVRIIRDGKRVTDMSIDEEDINYPQSCEIAEKIEAMRKVDDEKVNGLAEDGSWTDETCDGYVTSVKDNAIFAIIMGCREVRISCQDLPNKYVNKEPSGYAITKREVVKPGMEVSVKLRWNYRANKPEGQVP